MLFSKGRENNPETGQKIRKNNGLGETLFSRRPRYGKSSVKA
jgi:hypothetical protein